MPRYDFACECGARFEDCAPMDGPWPKCPKCGGDVAKQFTPTLGMVVPPWMRASHDTGNDGSHRRWMESPEVQEKLKTGEYSISSKGGDASQHY